LAIRQRYSRGHSRAGSLVQVTTVPALIPALLASTPASRQHATRHGIASASDRCDNVDNPSAAAAAAAASLSTSFYRCHLTMTSRRVVITGVLR